MRKIRFRLHKKKHEEEPFVMPVIDTIQEQIEVPMTTVFCPESIKEKELRDVNIHPEKYIEINIIKKIRIVDSFYIPSNLKNFTYKDTTYNITEEHIYLLPTKTNFFIPTSFYYESRKQSIDFRYLNKGITGKELTLLYDEELFKNLFPFNDSKYNLFIVILLIASLCGYAIGLYLSFSGAG